MGLRLFFLQNFPAATFIQGATFIPDSRVVEFYISLLISFRDVIALFLCDKVEA